MPVELLLAAPGEIELAEYEDVEPGPEQVHARALVSSISHGTELTLLLGRSPFGGKSFDSELRLFVEAEAPDYPARLGYEWVGEVIATGSSGLGVSVGDRIQAALPHRETQLIDIKGGVPWSSPSGRPPRRARGTASVGHDRAPGRSRRGASDRRPRGRLRPRCLWADER